MDNALSALLSVSFVLFSLMIAGFTYLARHIAEYILKKKNISQNNVWTELLLPIFPNVLGPMIAFFAYKYPFPPGVSSVSARVAFGIVAGLLSGFIYRWIKSAMKVASSDDSKKSIPPSK